MGIKNITVEKLNKLSRHKPMICFGAGGVLFEMFRKTENLHMEKNVKCVIDNDETKWNSHISVGNVEIPIFPISILRELDLDKYTIVITAKKYEDIYVQIRKYLGKRKINCYIYPNYREWICKVFNNIAKKLPMRNCILFQGEGDTCENANALGKYIKEHDCLKNYRLIWLCDNPGRFKETTKEKYVARNICMQAKQYTLKWRYYYYKACAKYLMFENEIIEKERKGQISVYMNHGSPPLKSTVGHIVLPKNVDYVVCPSENVSEIICKQYGVDEEKLIYCGSPRTDIFFSGEECINLQRELEVQRYKKVILWAPTFRSMNKKKRIDSSMEYPYGVPVVYSELDYRKLVEALRCKDILLVIKPHIYQDMSRWNLQTNDNIKIITQTDLELCESNVYDLMLLADSLVTDYSTIAFDYMLLDRMIGYTVDDMDKYNVGFSVENPLDYMPGYKIHTVDGFIEYLEAVCTDVDEYRDKRRKVAKYIHADNGGHCKKLLEMIGISLNGK